MGGCRTTLSVRPLRALIFQSFHRYQHFVRASVHFVCGRQVIRTACVEKRFWQATTLVNCICQSFRTLGDSSCVHDDSLGPPTLQHVAFHTCLWRWDISLLFRTMLGFDTLVKRGKRLHFLCTVHKRDSLYNSVKSWSISIISALQ